VITSPGLIARIPTNIVTLSVAGVIVVIVFSNGANGSIGTPELRYIAIQIPVGVIPGTSISNNESIGVSCVEPQMPYLLLTGADVG
jgi:hypothetical protein